MEFVVMVSLVVVVAVVLAAVAGMCIDRSVE